MLQYAKNLKYTKLNLVNKIVKQISVKHFSFHDVEKSIQCIYLTSLSMTMLFSLLGRP